MASASLVNISMNTSAISAASSFSSSSNQQIGSVLLNQHEQSTSNDASSSFVAESLPDMTVQAYLEKLRDEVEKRILDHAKQQNEKLWEDFDRERQGILEEAKRTRLTPKSTMRLVIVDVSSRDKDATKKYEFKVGGERAVTAKVGRSRGQQFAEGKGISLHWDNEVSTTHGHFLLKNDELMFEDLGSTNKTIVNLGVKQDVLTLTRNESAVLTKGDLLIVGASKIKIIDIKAVDS